MQNEIWVRKCALHGEFTTIHCIPCYEREGIEKVSEEYNLAAQQDVQQEMDEGFRHSDE